MEPGLIGLDFLSQGQEGGAAVTHTYRSSALLSFTHTHQEPAAGSGSRTVSFELGKEITKKHIV